MHLEKVGYAPYLAGSIEQDFRYPFISRVAMMMEDEKLIKEEIRQKSVVGK